MKQTFLSMLLVLTGAFSALAEDVHVTVHGSAPKGVTDVTVYNLNTNQALGTVKVVDGKFTFSNNIDESTFLRIDGNGTNKQCFFIADGATVFANMETGRVMGTRLSNKLDTFIKTIETYDDTFQKMDDALKTLTDTAKISQIKQLKVATNKLLDREVCKTIDANTDNIIPAFILRYYYEPITPEEKEKYLNSGAAYTKHPLLQQKK